jgi:hypothetical protein
MSIAEMSLFSDIPVFQAKSKKTLRQLVEEKFGIKKSSLGDRRKAQDAAGASRPESPPAKKPKSGT